jgi:hypothetical protein
MQAYEGVEVQLHPFLISALDGGEWITLLSDSFTLRKEPGTHQVGDWVGPRAGLDVSEKSKRFFLCRSSKPGHGPSRSPVALPITMTVYVANVLVLLKAIRYSFTRSENVSTCCVVVIVTSYCSCLFTLCTCLIV